MQARDRYPVDAVTGGCFVSQRYELDPGELICDLDIDLDALPAWGRLCVSEKGVRMMANCLGLEIPEQNIMDANARLREDNKRLKAQTAQMRRAIEEVLDAAKLAGLTAWMEPVVDLVEMTPVGADT